MVRVCDICDIAECFTHDPVRNPMNAKPEEPNTDAPKDKGGAMNRKQRERAQEKHERGLKKRLMELRADVWLDEGQRILDESQHHILKLHGSIEKPLNGPETR